MLCSDIPENSLVAEKRAAYFAKSDIKDLAQKLENLLADEKHIEDMREGTGEYICVISEELAMYNDLAVGDTIVITNPALESESSQKKNGHIL